jgi:hypothetical protein
MVRGPEIVGRAALADDVMVVFVGLFDAPIKRLKNESLFVQAGLIIGPLGTSWVRRVGENGTGGFSGCGWQHG